jgi:glycosyltransferase involved in cell wall biosynthesis
MVTHSFYESDNRILRYAETLAERGDQVEVICLRRSPSLPRHETLNGVLVHRIQDRFGKNESSHWSFLWPLVRFTLVASRWLSANGRSRRFDLIHVHNIPDFLVFSTWRSKLRGSRVLLDIHDIVPEFFGSKFGASGGSLLVRSLKLMERVSAAMANHVILANDLWVKAYSSRSAKPEKCSVFINYVDERVFRTREPKPLSKDPLITFPGGLQWHQGLDIAIRAFGELIKTIPNARFHIYGDGNTKPKLVALVEELGLGGHVKFFDPVSLREVARIMADADLGVVPKRADSFGNEAYSTKIMEFMSLGVPVVVSSTRVDRFYFNDNVVRFFESGNHHALAAAMHEVLTKPELRESLIRNASEYVRLNSWSCHKHSYLELVDSLVERKPIPPELIGGRAATAHGNAS